MILGADESEKVMVNTEKKIKRKRVGGLIVIIAEAEDKMYRVPFLRDGGLQTTHPFLSVIYKRMLRVCDVSHEL
jgi:hypothetical protein